VATVGVKGLTETLKKCTNAYDDGMIGDVVWTLVGLDVTSYTVRQTMTVQNAAHFSTQYSCASDRLELLTTASC